MIFSAAECRALLLLFGIRFAHLFTCVRRVLLQCPKCKFELCFLCNRKVSPASCSDAKIAILALSCRVWSVKWSLRESIVQV
jgi:hypothetical protein